MKNYKENIKQRKYKTREGLQQSRDPLTVVNPLAFYIFFVLYFLCNFSFLFIQFTFYCRICMFSLIGLPYGL